jgi:hypothetical protein
MKIVLMPELLLMCGLSRLIKEEEELALLT